MIKFFSRISFFVVFFIVSYCACLIAWGDFAPKLMQKNIGYKIKSFDFMLTRLHEIDKYKNIDILFLGSSLAIRGFDSRIFGKAGYTSFNLGSSAQTPLQTNVLLKRYLKKLNPKLIIYEVFPKTLLSVDGVEAALILISNDVVDLNALTMSIKINNIKVYNTLVYAFYRQLVHNDLYTYEKHINDYDDKYVSGGYMEGKLRYYKPKRIDVKELHVINDQLEAFEKNISLISNNNIKFILVRAPLPSSVYMLYNNNAKMDSLLQKYGEYYDFNKIMSLNDSMHFLDNHHLNQLGVEEFNKFLLKKLNLQKKLNKSNIQ